MSDSSATGFKKFVDNTKTFLKSRVGEIVVLMSLSVLALLFTILFYSIRFTELVALDVGRDELTFWTANDFYSDINVRVFGMNIYLSIAFGIGVALYAVAWFFMLAKKKKLPFFIATAYNAALGLVCLVFGTVLSLMRDSAVICCIISIFCSIAALSYLIALRRIARAAEKDGGRAVTDAELSDKQRKYKLALLICECVALIILATVLFIPVYSEGAGGTTYVLINSVGANTYPVYVSIGFIVMVIALFGEILFFISTISDYFGAKTFALRSRHFVLSTTVFTLIFFILGYCLTFYYNLSGEEGAAPHNANTISYIPFALSVVTMIVYSVFSGKFPVGGGEIKHDRRRNP
ncbi:MAG: hypothetical protein K2L88_03300, partial [Clostridiales bacterium]|nr:hypothetical protein [Clostridiales bacterium]